MSGAKRRNFLSCPSTFFSFTSKISRFGEPFRDHQYSLVTFFCFALLLSVPRAQSFLKVGARAPVPHGVGVTFVGQFHAKSITKQPFSLNAQCHKDYFPSACAQSYAQSDTVNSVLYKILTRVDILSGRHVPKVPQWHNASVASSHK